MKHPFLILFAIVLVSTNAYCQKHKLKYPNNTKNSDFKEYVVKQIQQKNFKIDGSLNDPIWKRVNKLDDFSFPWEKKDVPLTEFRAFYNSSNFYFSFKVEDNELVLLNEINEEMEIVNEDRVEIFFAKDKKLKEYYCIEIDSKGRVLDNSASFYRNFNYKWEMKDIKTKSSITKDGYIVEGIIPLKTFTDLGFELDKGSQMFAGVFRADFCYDKNDNIEYHWISWVLPKVKEPDFHTPSAFGIFIFE